MRKFSREDVIELKVDNVSVAIKTLRGDGPFEFWPTNGVMGKFNDEAKKALIKQKVEPPKDGTELDPDDCEFCVEGMLVMLFEPESLRVYQEEGGEWWLQYQPDNDYRPREILWDRDRFFRQHMGIPGWLASPSDSLSLHAMNDRNIRGAPERMAVHLDRLRSARLPG